MGNKQSGVSLVGQQNFGEPNSVSYSWQPDPLFSGATIKRGESFAGHGGVRLGDHLAPNVGSTTIQRQSKHYAPEFNASAYRQMEGSSPNLAMGNGSVVRGDAIFGGVQKELPKSALKNGGAGHSVNTADSGYMTEIAAHDSDKSARARLRGSRLSLNDAMLVGTEFGQQQPPQMAALPPLFVPIPPHHGMIQFGAPPPGAIGLLPPESFMLPPPGPNNRGVPMEDKKAKKFRKKQQKNQQQLNRHSSTFEPGEFLPPPGAFSLVPAPMIAYGPPPHQLMNLRSQSIDNFMAAGLVQPAIMALPPPPTHHLQAASAGLPVRRYNSQVDISSVGASYQTSTLQPGMGLGPRIQLIEDKTPTIRKERKYEKKKDQQAGSLRDSPLLSPRGRLDSALGIGKSVATSGPKNRLEITAGNETQTLDRRRSVADNADKNVSPINAKSEFDPASAKHRSEVIYETLKGNQKLLMSTCAEINKISVNPDSPDKEIEKLISVQESPPPPTPKPIVITPEAKAILERNARILIEAEFEKDQLDKENESKEERRIQQNPPAVSKMVEDLHKIPTPPPPPPTPPTQKQPLQKENSKAEIVSKMNVILKSQENLEGNAPKFATQTLKKQTQTQTLKRQDADKKLSHVLQNEKSVISPADKITFSSPDRDDVESLIEAILNPVLPRRKFKKPKDFEPLDAWRGINVQQELAKRQPQRMNFEHGGNQQQSIVEERIQVRLVPSPPSRREQHGGEPIYLEYDERLPEFKKRLIETGSFEIPEVEKFHHRTESQPSLGSRRMSPTRWEVTNGVLDQQQQHPRPSQPQLWRDYVAMEETAIGPATAQGQGSVRSRKTVDSNKGSLRRLKESVANIFRTKSNDQLKSDRNGHALSTATDELPPLFPAQTAGRYAPSLTPSISKIKAGDSSDIDFSWVHDLETRFRLEREQFERELQTLKQKSATLQRNDYMLSPKLHRQHSQQRSNEFEAARVDDRRVSPSPLRRAPSTGDHQPNFYQSHHAQEKSFSSSVDLALASARGAQTPPPPGRMSVYHSQQAVNDAAMSSRFAVDQQSKSRYFGIYDSTPAVLNQQQNEIVHRDPYERSFRNELQQIAPVNVRQKAALFENESHRVQREMEERNQQLAKKQQRSSTSPHRVPQQPQYRMGLQPQRSVEIEEPIYIPRPDYEETAANQPTRPTGLHSRQSSNGRANNSESTNEFPVSNGGRYDDRLLGHPFANEPLVVNTTANSGGQYRPNYGSSPRSPSERKLARYYHQNANLSLSPTNRANSGNRYESQPILGNTNTLGHPQGRYSPSSRSPRMLRVQQQNVANGFENGQQNTLKANRIGQRYQNGMRAVAFTNE